MDLIKCFEMSIAPSKLKKLILEGIVTYLQSDSCDDDDEGQIWISCSNLISSYAESANSRMHPNEIKEIYYKEILPTLQSINYGYDENIVNKLRNMGRKIFASVSKENFTSETDEQLFDNQLDEEMISVRAIQFDQIFSNNLTDDPLNLSFPSLTSSTNENAQSELLAVEENAIISNTCEEYLIETFGQQANLSGSQINEELNNTRADGHTYHMLNVQPSDFSDSFQSFNNTIMVHPSETVICIQKAVDESPPRDLQCSLDSDDGGRLVIDESATHESNEMKSPEESSLNVKTNSNNNVRKRGRPKFTNRGKKIYNLRQKVLLSSEHVEDASSSDVSNVTIIPTASINTHSPSPQKTNENEHSTCHDRGETCAVAQLAKSSQNENSQKTPSEDRQKEIAIAVSDKKERKPRGQKKVHIESKKSEKHDTTTKVKIRSGGNKLYNKISKTTAIKSKQKVKHYSKPQEAFKRNKTHQSPIKMPTKPKIIESKRINVNDFPMADSEDDETENRDENFQNLKKSNCAIRILKVETLGNIINSQSSSQKIIESDTLQSFQGSQLTKKSDKRNSRKLSLVEQATNKTKMTKTIESVQQPQIKKFNILDFEMADSSSSSSENNDELKSNKDASEHHNDSSSDIAHIDAMTMEKIDKYFDSMPKKYLCKKRVQDESINNKGEDSRELLSNLLSITPKRNESVVKQKEKPKTPLKKFLITPVKSNMNFPNLLTLPFSPIPKPKAKPDHSKFKLKCINDMTMVDSESEDEQEENDIINIQSNKEFTEKYLRSKRNERFIKRLNKL